MTTLAPSQAQYPEMIQVEKKVVQNHENNRAAAQTIKQLVT